MLICDRENIGIRPTVRTGPSFMLLIIRRTWRVLNFNSRAMSLISIIIWIVLSSGLNVKLIQKVVAKNFRFA